MSVRNLDSFFKPASIALIGASREANSVGNVVARNLITSGFKNPVWLVNPHGAEIYGQRLYPSVADLPSVPELAVIATPASTVPGLIAQIGAKGTKAAVVLSAGFMEAGEEGRARQAQMLEAAKPYTLRIVGPNCLGVLSPAGAFNASFAHRMPQKGGVALISQSGAMLTAIIDWAASRNIGFSHLVSFGGMADADFGDFLDYLAADAETRAVILYIESVRHARKFMSAARRCSRIKPVIVIKSGRSSEGAKAARSHTGALAGSDVVYDAAFRRGGMLRVATIEDLFEALETASRNVRVSGDRLAMLTNGGGAGVLATDYLMENGGHLAKLTPSTLEQLSAHLPKTWSHGNPVDIVGDAGPERYRASLEILRRDPGVDAIVAMNCPVAVADSSAAAQAVIDVVAEAKNDGGPPVFASWLGEAAAAPARHKLEAAGIPQFPTPENAVEAVLRLANYQRAQALLVEVPPATARGTHDTEAARRIVEKAVKEGRSWLSPVEAHDILKAYRIPTCDLRVATTPREAAEAAAAIGFPVAIKVKSPDILHKSDVGGVKLHLLDAAGVERAAQTMLREIAEKAPNAKVEGFLVQPMATRPSAHELIVGISEDELFGPVVLFGQGGTAVEVIADRALALPPLNAALARDLISRTRVSRLLAGYRDRLPVNIDAVIDVLLSLQDIAVELPQVKELDINPLWADHSGVLALDARIRVAPAKRAGTDRFAIKPYPTELVHTIADRSGKTYGLRPIRPEDADILQKTVAATAPEDMRMRFFSGLRQLPDALAKRLTQIDYDREMAFVLEEGDGSIGGVVRLSLDPDHVRGEYAIILRTDLKGRGLGYAMMDEILRYARSLGVKQVFGDVLAENTRMLKMADEFGFRREAHGPSPGVVEVTLNL
ncbi:MAG: GNAT family N-acetyltransferase [Alphaproteobacteria bacterium]|nr:GNAT family N-acetyltransferase [Alphaproteobacteria bacterium]